MAHLVLGDGPRCLSVDDRRSAELGREFGRDLVRSAEFGLELQVNHTSHAHQLYAPVMHTNEMVTMRDGGSETVTMSDSGNELLTMSDSGNELLTMSDSGNELLTMSDSGNSHLFLLPGLLRSADPGLELESRIRSFSEAILDSLSLVRFSLSL